MRRPHTAGAWLVAMGIGLAVPAIPALAVESPASPTTRPQDQPEARGIDEKLADHIRHADIRGATVRQAFEWWSRVTQIPLVIAWDQLAVAGIDPERAVDVDMTQVPAGVLLAYLMKAASTDKQTLMFEKTPWYVQVLTKEEANKHTVTRVYDVGDLILDVPDFKGPADFNLSAALSGAGGSSSSIFVTGRPADAVAGTRQERGEAIAQLIRDTIEPTIWIENGGKHASVRYFQGRLVVNAPLYVHQQIGIAAAPTPRLPQP